MAANTGVLTPPDRLYRYGGLSDSEMEKSFRTMDNDINRRQKHLSFEDRKNTPVIIKGLLSLLAVVGIWKGGKYLLKK
jgi:hypothetical protein